MTETGSRKIKPIPLWALGAAALVVAVWNVAQLPFLADYAFLQARGKTQDPVNLIVLAFFSGVISVLTIWAFLLFVFRGRYSASVAVAIVAGLAAVAIFANAIGAPLAFGHVVGRDDREASAAAKAAVKQGKRFKDPADAALVAEAIRALQKITGDENIGAVAVHAIPGETGRAVCGDVAFNSETQARTVWAGFVAYKPAGEEALTVVQETDGFSDKGRAKCAPLVKKYLGEIGVDEGEATMAFSRAGCKELDAHYWMEWKAYCSGKPVAVAAPAR